MFNKRIGMATLSAVIALSGTAGSVAAKKPTPSAQPSSPTEPSPGTAEERPLTPQEIAEADAKYAAALDYVNGAEARTLALSPLGCVTPTGGSVNIAGPGVTPDGCSVPQGFISVSARDQTKGIYCGPAVGQVIANYSWAMAANANKYTQAQIAGWMGTDVNGGTSAPNLEVGLEKATAGAPRRPANWNWVVAGVSDQNGNGDTGDELFNMLRSNISGSKMGLAIPVKPHRLGATYWLVSWPRVVNSVGHWVSAYGWVGMYTKGSNYSRLYFTDSSKDEGGATGKFYNSVLSIAWMIQDHTRRLVW